MAESASTEPEHTHAIHNGYCATRPQPGSLLTDPCGDCGHAIVLHVGVAHCPVCEMVDLNRQLYEIVKGGPRDALMRAALHAGGGSYPHIRR